MKKIIVIALALTLLSAYTFAQMPRLFTMEHGLTTTRLNSSYIDEEGMLWIAGERTLSFFDGNRFHSVIEPGTEFANRANSVYSIKQNGENQYLVATDLGLYLFNSKTYQFTQINIGEPEGNRYMPGFPVSAIHYIEKNTQAIITTSGFGATVIDLNTHKAIANRTKSFNEAIEDRFVYTVINDSKNDIWVSTSIEPVIRLNPKTFKRIPVNIDPVLRSRIINGCPIVCMLEDPKTHNILLGASGLGMLIYDRATNTIREISNNISSVNPCAMVFSKLGDLFVGTDNAGIMQYNHETESITPVQWDLPSIDLNVGKVHHITEDADGNLVASLYQSGVLIVPSHINKMTYIPVSRTSNGINSSPISSLYSSDNSYWIGTDGSGMFQTNRMQFRDVKNISAGLNMPQMTSVVTDAYGSVWASSYGGGIQLYDGAQWITPSYVTELKNQNVLSMITDKQTNKIYVCVNGSGLYEVDIPGQKTTKLDLPEIGNRWVQQAEIDSKRNLWIMFANGLCYYNLDTHKAKGVNLSEIKNAQINDIAAVSDKVYFATNQGLASYSQKSNMLTFEDVSSKFAEQNVMSVQPVDGNLWIALSHSISCANLKTKEVTNYTSFPGFYIGELHRRSKTVSKDGFVCFGGDNGIIAISTTKDNDQRQHVDKLLITGLLVNGERIVYNPESDENILGGSILTIDEIRLKHNQNTFNVSFGSTEYAHSDEIEYEYTLEGYEDIWHSATVNSAFAYYSSVPPGHYQLHIKARYNYNETFTEKSISIIIEHPWYSTWWANLIYLLIIAAICCYAYQMYKIRHAEKAKLRQLEHNEQIKEAKLRLFTSIAHELRTPLTMIVSPLKQLKTSDNNKERQSLYDVMQRNCDRLLNIVKQITDVRKIDNGQLHLHFSEFDFVKYCNDIMESFKGISVAKSIQFTHDCEPKSIMLWADTVHFEKIIINILSNAFKFTPNDGQIVVHTECKPNNDGVFADSKITDYLYCSIYNSGSHISEQDLEHIYERFYQGTANSTIVGSGIGLNLTRELIKLHHSTISVRNVDDGVEFAICVPLGKLHLTEEELKPRESEIKEKNEQESNKTQIDTLASTIATEQSLETQESDEPKKKKQLLIVDDDREMCEYMRSQLEADYSITTCFSGNTAWKQVLAIRPDAVITDYIMPDGDGCELCKRIKENPETAHIAVIMLTAESNEQSHLMSMSVNVDHFLTKPFNIALVRSALTQVLRLRENLMSKKNRTQINHDYQEVEIDSYEDKFYTKINEIIKRSLEDSNFTVEALAKEVGISRVHLNRKLKEHYGISPNAFIRSARLKQAAYLLVNNKVNISEVAYKVGFASHSYFSNNFHDYFGMTPTEFVAYYSDKVNDEQLKKLLE